ncbi:pentatricopeptide repeat-containing protein At1g08070, chloroplastic [Salvia splendens]|uniref:pentatricopeptide repeat-containing protein At1g08070, chloroplastic n=1 Tax=Salvia splendens TaxID=180675 RepID=UPI001C27B978|nr:pentatricopeptide repeat-containing protein At1g08070, chloroplastic [Salvia splendens]
MTNQNLLLFCARATSVISRIQKPAFVRSFYHPVRGLTNPNTDIYSCNRIISGLLKSGSLDSALKLFDEMHERDVITWNIMISGHYRCGLLTESLSLYNQMVLHCCVESSSTFSTILSICSSKGLFREGCEVHCRAVVLGFSTNVYVGSALVDLYLRMGCTGIALRLFGKLQERNLATWNVALRGMCETGRVNELFGMYDEMKLEGVEPNGVTYCYLIRGCGYERGLEEGMQLHCCVIKGGLVDSDLFVANALVDFYSACGSLMETRKVFEAIPPSDVISWNSLVSVCAASGCIHDGLEAFREMRLWDKKPSACSFLGFLKVSSAARDLVFGQQTHCSVLKAGLNSVLVQSALIDMYGKWGEIGDAVGIFDGVFERTLECCNSLMTSLLKYELWEDVVDLFCVMVDEGIGFDEVSLSSALKALAGSSGCTLLHCCAVKSGFESDAAVACALIDAYSRAGEVELSCRVFNLLPSPNVICFTSVISAQARNGKGKECLEMLDLMIRNGLKPDKVTFLSALMGCSHSGLVEEGRSVFQSMEAIHGLEPERQHYSCMVDLLGRAGLLDEATEMMKDTPWEDDFVIWSSVLRSCRNHREEQLGSRAAKKLIDLPPENPSSWMQASYFYSDIGDFERTKEYREIATARKVRREIGRSMIEIKS